MNKDFIAALDELERERNIPKAQILDAVSKALVSAYKGKNKTTEKNEENVIVEIDEKTGEIEILRRKKVVETVEDEDTEVSLSEMREFDESYDINERSYKAGIENIQSRLATMSGGMLTVRSIPGEGTTAVITIPKRKEKVEWYH